MTNNSPSQKPPETSPQSVAPHERLAEVQTLIREYKTLLSSEAWVQLANAAKQQIDVREFNIRKRCKSVEDQLDAEYMKGEVGGIQLFLKIPSLRIELLESEVPDLQRMIEEGVENVNENEEDFDAGSWRSA